MGENKQKLEPGIEQGDSRSHITEDRTNVETKGKKECTLWLLITKVTAAVDHLCACQEQKHG